MCVETPLQALGDIVVKIASGAHEAYKHAVQPEWAELAPSMIQPGPPCHYIEGTTVFLHISLPRKDYSAPPSLVEDPPF